MMRARGNRSKKSLSLTPTPRLSFLQGESMIPYRIEAYLDLKRHFQWLRESPRLPTIPTNVVVVAEEFSGDGDITRTWFVTMGAIADGQIASGLPPHRLVTCDIRPGEPTPDADLSKPLRTIEEPLNEVRLHRARQEYFDAMATRERHLIYSQTYLDALQRANDSEAATKRMQDELTAKALAHAEELKSRDDVVWELRNECEANRQQIATLQASYAALENRKSLPERVKAWGRSKVKKWRESWNKGTNALANMVRRDTHSS
jgi:hypothetical protein